MKDDDKKLNKLIFNLNKRESEDLKRLKLKKEECWTEEVIIPEIILEKLYDNEKQSWEPCDLSDIYSSKDILNLFGVKADKLNKCFSKKFYNLTTEELEEWAKIGKDIKTELPINEILIIFTQ